MNFEEWIGPIDGGTDLGVRGSMKGAYEAGLQAGSDARKEKDAQIARDAASHNMASIVHAQNIAELIEEAE